MRIDVREPGGDNPSARLGRIDVDPIARPPLVRLPAQPLAQPPAQPGAASPPPGATGGLASEGATGAAAANGESGSERFLNWEGAIDDGGHLRKCVICGCEHLYRSKALPQVTPFVVVLAFAGAFIGLLGYSRNVLVLPILVVLLLIDIATLALASERLICYDCGSVYARLKIARYHRRWNRTTAERVRQRSLARSNDA